MRNLTLLLPLLLFSLDPSPTLPADFQEPSLFPSPNFDLNGDSKIQGAELTLIQAHVPQFIIVSSDDNGHEDGLEFLRGLFRAYGIEGRVTYFLTGDYRTEGPKYTGGRVEEFWREITLSDHLGLHTMSHPEDGHLLSITSWLSEQEGLEEYITKSFFLPPSSRWSDYFFGSRAPVLRYNRDYFTSLSRLAIPVKYDSSIDVGDSSFPEKSNFYACTFPYTLDNGASADSFPSLLPPDYRKKAEIHPSPGLWEVPIYMWYHKGRWTSSYDLNIWMDFGFRIPPSSPEALEMLLDNLKMHLHGNRAPFTLNLHPQNFTSERRDERALLKAFFEEVKRMIRKGERIEFISNKGIIEWMKDGTPPEMTLLSEDFTACRGKEREIKVKVRDDTLLSTVTLFYRPRGHKGFKKVDFSPSGNDVMTAKIPAEDVRSRVIQFYIHAVDSRLNPVTLPDKSFYSLSVIGRDESPPAPRLERKPLLGTGEPFELNALLSTDNTAIKRVTWDINLNRDSDGDGDPQNDIDGDGFTIRFKEGFGRLGEYRIKARVEDISSLSSEVIEEIKVDHFYFREDFSDWTALSGGPSYERLRIGKGKGLNLFLDGSWWFSKGTKGVAEYIFPSPVRRLRVLYMADFNPLISVYLAGDDGTILMRFYRGYREQELILEKPLRKVSITFEIMGDIETRDSSFLKIEELRAWPEIQKKSHAGDG